MRWIEHQWYQRGAVALCLAPLSALFGLAVRLRRWLYGVGILPTWTAPVPVIVVGNIVVGGTGKTPTVIWLAQRLTQAGYRPGIVARGYGGGGQTLPVREDSTPSEVGDEPVLLRRRTHVPVYVGVRRPAAVRALLSAHPECDVILCDDGLQHYALARDIEIALVDTVRGLGNGFLLPAGPLREPPQRLDLVDAIVCQGRPTSLGRQCFVMTLQEQPWRNVQDPHQTRESAALGSAPMHAMAGIGHPERFFLHLEGLGLRFFPHPFPDHHPFTSRDLGFAGDDTVLMTEKDAVKCAAFAKPNWWYLPVSAEIDPALADLILSKLSENSHGRKAS